MVKEFLKSKSLLKFAGVMALAAVFISLPTSALTYQSKVGVNFTFGSTLNVTLSSADLVIPYLAPGTYDDSNIITVNINTNAAYGYTLSASAGDGTTYSNTNLVNSKNNTFTSLATSASIASMNSANDNYWGYSFSEDSGNTWNNYSGLPYCAPVDTECSQGTELISTTNTAEANSIQFKIGAKASSDQPSGEYRNVINFYAIAAPEPATLAKAYADAGKTQLNGYYKLQDMNEDICDAAEVLDEGSQMQAIDTRDNKVYWITKLQDGHCWMTQNLDLDIDSSVTYTHDDTDLGWGSDTTTTSWTPTRSTIDATNGTITGWTNDYNTPYSVDTGDYYYAGYDGTTLLPSATTNYLTITPDSNGDIINSSNNNVYFSTDPSRVNGGTHEHVGNYYNWSAAVASNDTNSYASSTYSDISGNPQNSICPAGWRLPTISSASNATEGSTNELSRINRLYNNASTSTSAGLEAAPLFFARGGNVNGGSLNNSGNNGNYWSSSVNSSSNAYNLNFNATNVNPTNNNNRNNGRSVRCVAR